MQYIALKLQEIYYLVTSRAFCLGTFEQKIFEIEQKFLDEKRSFFKKPFKKRISCHPIPNNEVGKVCICLYNI